MFGVHTAIVCMLMVLIGQDVWSIGLFISMKARSHVSAQYRWAIDLNEGVLFWAMFSVFITVVVAFLYAITVWAGNGYEGLALEVQFVVAATVIMQVIQIHAALMATSLIRRLVYSNT